MAEYYAVLSRAIGGLSNTSPDTRRAVYDKARNALISQLKAIAPPLPTTEISRQRLELEEAIRRVEREIQTGVLPLTPRVTPLPAPAPPPAAAAPTPAPAARQAAPADAPSQSPAADLSRRSPQEIFRQAILDAEGRVNAAPAERAKPARPAAVERAQPARPAAAERLPPPPEEPVEAPRTAPDMNDVAARAPRAAPQRPMPSPARSFGTPMRPPADPRIAPDYDYEGEGEAAAVRPPVGREMRLGPAPIDPEIDDVAPSRRGNERRGVGDGRDEDETNPPVAARRRSRAPLLVLLLLLIVAGGVAYAGWTERDNLRSIIASFQPAAKPPTAAATVAVAPDDTSSTKNGDRLLPPGQAGQPAQPSQSAQPPPSTLPSQSSAPAQPAQPDKQVRVIGSGSVPGTPSPPAGSTVGQGSVPSGSTLIPPVATGPGPATPSTPNPALQPQASLSPPPASTQTATPAGPTVMQKATLYEEVTDPKAAPGSTLSIAGSVSWSFVTSPTDGPEVVGTVTIPDRKMTVKLTVRRNTDTSLPASHMIEVLVTTPPDGTAFPGKSVQSVPTMVLKTSETDHGIGVTGASATVAAGFYWIALSGAPKDVASNLALFKTKTWIDLYFVYQTGQRAILTLEEGSSGTTAFNQALTAWQTG